MAQTSAVGPITVCVFGESRGSPGLAGFGVIAADARGKEQGRRGMFLGVATRAQSQFRAVLEGLKLATELGAVEVVTGDDSTLRQVTGQSSAHIPEVAELLVEIRELLGASPQIVVRFAKPEETDLAERIAGTVIGSRGRRIATE
jgi:ribonuclease HI